MKGGEGNYKSERGRGDEVKDKSEMDVDAIFEIAATHKCKQWRK